MGAIKQSRLTIFVVAGILACVALWAYFSGQPSLVGTWRMQPTPEAAANLKEGQRPPDWTLTFKEDGTYVERMDNRIGRGQVVDSSGKYAWNGATLVLSGEATTTDYSEGEPKKSTRKMQVELVHSGGALRLKADVESQFEFRRETEGKP